MTCWAGLFNSILSNGTSQMFCDPSQYMGQMKFTWRNNPGTFTSLSADGVALGAAASTSQTSVQLIVFVAIMLHKVSQQPKICSLVIKRLLKHTGITKDLKFD